MAALEDVVRRGLASARAGGVRRRGGRLLAQRLPVEGAESLVRVRLRVRVRVVVRVRVRVELEAGARIAGWGWGWGVGERVQG